MQKTKFRIQGIKCGNCSLLIEEKLKSKEGVARIKVDYDSNKGVVIFDEQKITEGDIYQAIENINDFQLEKIEEIAQEQDLGTKKIKFKVKGLKCKNCVLLIESRLKDRPGVIKVKVDQSSNKGVVIYDRQRVNEGDIYKTIEEIGGFKVEKLNDTSENTEESSNYNNPEASKEVKPPIGSSTVQIISNNKNLNE